MKMTLFIDETCATLNGKVSYESTTISQFCFVCQRVGGKVVIWQGKFICEAFGRFRVPKCVKSRLQHTISASWAIFDTMAAWRPQLKRCILNFQHDNILPLSAKTTLAFLWSIGIKGDRLLQCHVYYPELSSIENFWGILNQAFYHIK